MFPLYVSRRSGDNVASDAAQDVGLVGRHTLKRVVEQSFDDGDEGIAIVIAKWGQPMTLETDLKDFG